MNAGALTGVGRRQEALGEVVAGHGDDGYGKLKGRTSIGNLEMHEDGGLLARRDQARDRGEVGAHPCPQPNRRS